MKMKTGSVYWFKYNNFKHDRTPIALILYPGDGKSPCHAININYLPDNLTERVIKFITMVASRQLSDRNMRGLYHDYIKKKLNPVVQLAYRTYSPKEISGPKIICKGFDESLGFLYRYKTKFTKKETKKLHTIIKTKVVAGKEAREELIGNKKRINAKAMGKKVEQFVKEAAETTKKLQERKENKKYTKRN